MGERRFTPPLRQEQIQRVLRKEVSVPESNRELSVNPS